MVFSILNHQVKFSDFEFAHYLARPNSNLRDETSQVVSQLFKNATGFRISGCVFQAKAECLMRK
jgi:hypothetical protein